VPGVTPGSKTFKPSHEWVLSLTEHRHQTGGVVPDMYRMLRKSAEFSYTMERRS
jgi:hypothetical protein